MSAASLLGGFAARQRASEGQHFSAEEHQVVLRHLEKLVQQVRWLSIRGPHLPSFLRLVVHPSSLHRPRVAANCSSTLLSSIPCHPQQGKADASALASATRAAEAAASSGLPTEIVTGRREYVYQHVPGLLPGEPLLRGRQTRMRPGFQRPAPAPAPLVLRSLMHSRCRALSARPLTATLPVCPPCPRSPPLGRQAVRAAGNKGVHGPRAVDDGRRVHLQRCVLQAVVSRAGPPQGRAGSDRTALAPATSALLPCAPAGSSSRPSPPVPPQPPPAPAVAEGKRLASTPPPTLTFYEQVRANRIGRAQVETPTMAGIRLLPVFSPGR